MPPEEPQVIPAVELVTPAAQEVGPYRVVGVQCDVDLEPMHLTLTQERGGLGTTHDGHLLVVTDRGGASELRQEAGDVCRLHHDPTVDDRFGESWSPSDGSVDAFGAPDGAVWVSPMNATSTRYEEHEGDGLRWTWDKPCFWLTGLAGSFRSSTFWNWTMRAELSPICKDAEVAFGTPGPMSDLLVLDDRVVVAGIIEGTHGTGDPCAGEPIELEGTPNVGWAQVHDRAGTRLFDLAGAPAARPTDFTPCAGKICGLYGDQLWVWDEGGTLVGHAELAPMLGVRSAFRALDLEETSNGELYIYLRDAPKGHPELVATLVARIDGLRL